jgi:peptidoglycan/LPS O-acetylase OafA/YrhL
MLTGVTLMLICLLGANQMFLEFVIGITVYFINRFVNLKECLFKFIAIFAVLIFLLLFSVDYSSDVRVFIYGIPCALMLLACANINLAPTNRLVVLGEISYSLYLSQSLLLFWFVKGSMLITDQLLQFLCLFLLTPVSCVVIAFFIHKFIEIPLSNRTKNYFSR